MTEPHLSLYYSVDRKIGTTDNKEKYIAKPIKETPALYYEDACRFEMAAHNVKPLSKERRDEMFETFERVRKCCDFAL